MAPNTSQAARIEQDGPSKIPVMTEGDPTPELMQEFENGCLDHFESKEIPEDKQTARIRLSGTTRVLQ